MAGVTLTKAFVTTDTTKMYTNAVVTWSEGINAPSGVYDSLMLKGSVTSAADPAASDIGNLLTAIRIVINGEVTFDWRQSGANTAVTNTCSQWTYFLNKIGGRAYETPTATAKSREFFWEIPTGRSYDGNVVRIETIVEWGAAAQAIASGSLEWWIKFNPNVAQTTTVAPATSFRSAIANEQVVVRVPQNAPAGSVVSGLFINNEDILDEYGSQGIRINALSDFGQTIGQIRMENGDIQNGTLYFDPATAASQTLACGTLGAIFVPTYGLAGGDIVMAIDSSAATTRRYVPVLTAPRNGSKAQAEVRQTQAVQSSTVKAILKPAQD